MIDNVINWAEHYDMLRAYFISQYEEWDEELIFECIEYTIELQDWNVFNKAKEYNNVSS